MASSGERSAAGRPRLLRATGLMFAARVGGAVLALVNVLVVSRALGPSGRGSVVFLMTVAILSSQVAAFSVSESVSNIAGSGRTTGARSPERPSASRSSSGCRRPRSSAA